MLYRGKPVVSHSASPNFLLSSKLPIPLSQTANYSKDIRIVRKIRAHPIKNFPLSRLFHVIPGEPMWSSTTVSPIFDISPTSEVE